MKIRQAGFFGIVLIIALIGVFYFSHIGPGHDWGCDFAMYIQHAKNIVHGISYGKTGYIYNSLNPIGPKSYPPVFPLLLVPVYFLFGANFTAMKFEVIVFFLLALWVIYLAFKNFLPAKYLVVITALVGMNRYFFYFKENVLSDLPFLFFIYLAFFLILRSYRSNKNLHPGILFSGLLGFCLYLPYGVRSVGIIILLSMIICEMIKFGKISKLSIRAIAWFALIVILQQIVFRVDNWGYLLMLLSHLKYIFNQFMDKLSSYNYSLSQLFDNGYNEVLTIVLFGIIYALALTGFVRKLKKDVTVMEIFLLLYIAQIIVWWFPSHFERQRYLIPLVPLIFFYSFWEIENGFFSRKVVLKNIVFAVVTLAVFVSYAGLYSKKGIVLLEKGVFKKESIELFDFIKKNTAENDVLIFNKPRVLVFFTGRPASVYHMPDHDKDLWDYLVRIKAGYVIAANGVFDDDRTFLSPFLERHKDNFQKVYSNSDFNVYKIKGSLLVSVSDNLTAERDRKI